MAAAGGAAIQWHPQAAAVIKHPKTYHSPQGETIVEKKALSLQGKPTDMRTAMHYTNATIVVRLSHRGSRTETHAAAAMRQPCGGPLGIAVSCALVTNRSGSIVQDVAYDAWGTPCGFNRANILKNADFKNLMDFHAYNYEAYLGKAQFGMFDDSDGAVSQLFPKDLVNKMNWMNFGYLRNAHMP